MMNGSVLLVSDDPETGQIWVYALGQRNLEVVLAGSADEAVTRWQDEVFDLIVIDEHTCQLDGVDLCQRLRTEAVIPILLLTPKSDESRILNAYHAGADDCIVKPVSPPVFLAKVRAWLRRSWMVAGETLDSLKVDGLQLDPSQRQLIRAGEGTVSLTNLEFRLLYLLMRHQGRVLESEVIIDRVWGYNGGGDSVVLKNVVYRLRRKIEPDPSQPCYIQTVNGVGYTFQLQQPSLAAAPYALPINAPSLA
jgi:DNA-binding response OmpR family regulator